MKKTILNILESGGKISSKRLITLIAFLLISTAFVANLFFSMTVDVELLKSMEMIVEIGLGTVVAEHFGNKK